MKKQLLFVAVALLSIVSFSCKKNLLGTDTYIRGGGGASSGTLEPGPSSFKRNNGNGTCGGSAQIRAGYDVCPGSLPVLEAVYHPSNGVLGPALTGLTFGAGDMTPCSNNNSYISFCIYGGNIPPANSIIMQFYYPSTGQVFLINNEGDPYIL